jgi:hypothetical protein
MQGGFERQRVSRLDAGFPLHSNGTKILHAPL